MIADRRDLLIHFLNAMLVEDFAAPVAEVDILNPYNERETLDQTLFAERPEYAHRYCLRDDQGRRLVDHGAIRLLELSKFQGARAETDAERWLKLLKDGEQLDPRHLPEWMQHPIMRQAMSILNRARCGMRRLLDWLGRASSDNCRSWRGLKC